MDQHDPVEDVVKHIHIVLPIVGAVLSFMLAFIAITMAYRCTVLDKYWHELGVHSRSQRH